MKKQGFSSSLPPIDMYTRQKPLVSSNSEVSFTDRNVELNLMVHNSEATNHFNVDDKKLRQSVESNQRLNSSMDNRENVPVI